MKLPIKRGYENLLTEDQAVEALGLADRPNPKGALRWLTRTRKLPYVRIGRGILRFRPCDIVDFVDRNHHDSQ